MADADTDTETTNTSTSQFVAALVLNIVLFSVFVTAFFILRPKNRKFYEPRALKPELNEKLKVDKMPDNPIEMFKVLWNKHTQDAYVIRKAGLDGYFFLRYLYLSMTIFAIGIVLLWPILFPVNATGSAGNTGLDQLSYSNINPSTQRNRYFAHVFLGWIYYGVVLFILYRELLRYVSIREAVITSPNFDYAGRIGNRSILVQNIPNPAYSESALRAIYPSARKIWLNRSNKKLVKKIKKRDKLASKLEVAENKLLKTAYNNYLKAEKKHKPISSDADIDTYVPRKKRPTHRLKPIIGEKVDTVDYAREKIPVLNAEIKEMQGDSESGSAQNSAFIEFSSIRSAQLAVQSVAFQQPMTMTPRYTGIDPNEVIWSNLNLKWWERLIKSTAAMAFIIVMIIFWAAPVAFVGALSNIDYLTDKVHFLKFVKDLKPHALVGVITGLLPAVLLSVLMALVPIVLRLAAKISGEPSKSLIEYKVQNYYFAFQFVEVFLVVMLASSATSVVTQIIRRPGSAMDLLAQHLPQSSNFYITYIILQGLTISSGMLLQIVGLFLSKIIGRLFDNTPRKMFNRYISTGGLGWGTVFPVYTNLTVIVMAYSLISPLMLGFALVAYLLLYIVFMYNLLVANTDQSNIKGLTFPRAIFQTFTGLYLSEVCMIALFVMGNNWACVVLQAVTIAVTAFVHVNLKKSMEPVFTYIPRSLLLEFNNNSTTRHSLAPSNGGYSTDDQALLPPGERSDSEKRDSQKAFHPVGSTHALSLTTTGGGGGVGGDLGGPVANRSDVGKFKQFFMPFRYDTFDQINKYVLDDPEGAHYLMFDRSMQTHNFEDDDELAYANPSEQSKPPLIWIASDPLGLAGREIEMASPEIDMSDEGALLTEKAKLTWVHPPPDYQEE